MNDDQLPIDLGIDLDDPVALWQAWNNPTRRATQSGRFLHRISSDDLFTENLMWSLPYLGLSPRTRQINDAIKTLFPDMTAALNPENASLADEFVCFIAEAFTTNTGATLYNDQPVPPGRSFYTAINPALRYPFTDRTDTLWELADQALRDGWATVGALLHDATQQHDDWREDQA
ncbi:hypothetical protein [Nocardia callitridis]|uniref:Uncharacterized protein n=1 Tax=Nocardia callitridis TaxID=648753 RepID=A0ABP9KDC9_9NOCA